MSKVKVRGEIMYFLVNASPPKPLDVEIQTLRMLCFDKKRVFAIVYHQLKSS